jgi:Predicted signal transduction protein with a C-terminal ATPase domain
MKFFGRLFSRRKRLTGLLASAPWERIVQTKEWKRLPLHSELERCFTRLVAEATKEKAAQVDEQQMRLIALQSQINSHFLYNTLECIRGQALLDDNKNTADMLETLSTFFRYSTSRRENVVMFQDELINTQNYMKIQQYRFGNRFSLDIEPYDPAAGSCFVPKLVLQPVIENAVLHAFEDRRQGQITLTADMTENLFIITISDNGSGMDENTLRLLRGHIQGETDSGGEKKAGIALANVQKRIRMLFGAEYGISVYSTVGLGTDVEITLPCVFSRG